MYQSNEIYITVMGNTFIRKNRYQKRKVKKKVYTAVSRVRTYAGNSHWISSPTP